MAVAADRLDQSDDEGRDGATLGAPPTLVAIDNPLIRDERESALLAEGLAEGLSRRQRVAKRTLDVFIALVILVLAAPLLLILTVAVRLSSAGPAFFRQERVGQFGRTFMVIKLRTMRRRPSGDSSITIAHDPRVTPVGSFLRATRFDELPQLWNVLKGEMSLVGPRPDVPGFADELRGADRRILSLRPGITGTATIYFRNEAELLANQRDPARYNDQVIYPRKVQLNLGYLDGWSFRGDLALLVVTAVPSLNAWLRCSPEPDAAELELHLASPQPRAATS
jgi:lipopolysaccharide/colanic/teichoic acid biosynthesis glycosyltransferase